MKRNIVCLRPICRSLKKKIIWFLSYFILYMYIWETLGRKYPQFILHSQFKRKSLVFKWAFLKYCWSKFITSCLYKTSELVTCCVQIKSMKPCRMFYIIVCMKPLRSKLWNKSNSKVCMTGLHMIVEVLRGSPKGHTAISQSARADTTHPSLDRQFF